MLTRLFLYYFTVTFAAASVCYQFLHWLSGGRYVFGGLMRMFMYHEQHPFQYIALICLIYAIAATLVTPWLARFSWEKRALLIVLLMAGTILFASVPGGVLWSLHDMQAGYFPTGERFWRALLWGATTGAQCGWLVILLSIPYNFIGLLAGYAITETGVRYFRARISSMH